TLLKYIQNIQLPVTFFEEYVWKICVHDSQVIEKNKSEVFLYADFEKLSQIVPSNEYTVLLELLNHLSNSLPLDPKIIKWIEWLIEKQHLFDLILFTEIILKYVNDLRNQSIFEKAFYILYELPLQDDGKQKQIHFLLWDSFEKLLTRLPKESLKKITSKYIFLEGKNVPQNIKKQLIKIFLDHKTFSDQDLKLIFFLINSMQSHEIDLWMPLWERLDQEVCNEEIKQIIIKSWGVQKNDVKHLNTSPKFLDLWKLISRCLYKTSHPDLIYLYQEVAFLLNLISNANIALIKQVLDILLKGAINQIDLIEFDNHQINNILSFHQSYSNTLFFQKKKSIEEVDNWNKEINEALINHLITSSNPFVIEKRYMTIHNQLDATPLDQAPSIQLLQWIDLEIQFFMSHTLNNQSLNLLNNLCEKIGQRSLIPVKTLLNYALHLKHFDSIQKHLFLSIIQRGSPLELQIFKKMFFNQLDELIRLNQIEKFSYQFEWIKKLKNYCDFSLYEQTIEATIAYQLFNDAIYETQSNPNNLLQKADLFFIYAPYFISNSTLLENSILKVIESFSLLKKHSYERQQSYFQYVMDLLLEMPSKSNYKNSLKDYEKKIFTLVFKYVDDLEIFVNYFHEFVKTWLNKAKNDPLMIPKAIHAVEIHAYFAPPIYDIKEKLKSSIICPRMQHWLNVKKLLIEAKRQSLFKNDPEKLVLLERWDDGFQSSSIKKVKISHIKFVNQTLCSFDAVSKQCVWHAGK
ncbi:MAG: hypothetical protein Q8K60_04205, partial [Parachlamydiaceae bacterium]|nr:hypothetical protein [Parachlamydiaceae bacterium]